ncbi:MAG: type I-E CRISPR-associated protein Cse2/CasB [Rhodospirillales bacterium]|nr:type I-E CRISPR-associated protein Cse2/CasB [Rhodospirillales bacterium]
MTAASTPGGVAAVWWHRTFRDEHGSGRASRARLRRCLTPVDAIAIEAVHDLNGHLEAAGHHPRADRLALLAITLAHVEEDGRHPFAELLGARPGKDAPRALSELRWQALIRITHPLELIAPLRRALAVVRHRPIHVGALAGDLYRWNDTTRTKWCFQYFGAGSTAPDPLSHEDHDA